MATYSEISRKWFYLRHPKGMTYEAFEAEPGEEDRKRTHEILERMRQEVPLSARKLFGIKTLTEREDSLDVLDAVLNAARAEEWMQGADPDDPNNNFKL